MPVSYQAQSPVLGMVLPSNSPGVHTLWLPIIPMQIGLVLKPGPQEPWTPYRMAAGVRPGRRAQAGHRHLSRPRRRRRRRAGQHCPRSLIFGGTATVEQYKGNPRVQAHGPGFSKILLGDDEVDNWREVPRHHGRQRLRQQRPRLHQLLRHLGVAAHQGDRRGHRRAHGPGRSRCRRKTPRPPWPPSPCPARPTPSPPTSTRTSRSPASHDMTAKYGPRLVKKERCDYLRPTVMLLRFAGHGRSPRRSTCSPS